MMRPMRAGRENFEKIQDCGIEQRGLLHRHGMAGIGDRDHLGLRNVPDPARH